LFSAHLPQNLAQHPQQHRGIARGDVETPHQARKKAEAASWYCGFMGIETLISVDDYLNTSYDPDVEFVDGVLVERNVGDWLHSLVQSNIIFALRRKYPSIKAVPELRSMVNPTRFRLPDVCVMLSAPTTSVLLEPPFVAIEILSEDDRMTRVIAKLKEYAGIGTPHIWLFDPRPRQMFLFRSNSLLEIEGDLISTDNPHLELTREEVFHE
jgi:Uma2 family endonuclease